VTDPSSAEAHPPRILLIEDNDVVLRVLSRMLAGAGYDVHEASNGKSGLAAYRQQSPDLVIYRYRDA